LFEIPQFPADNLDLFLRHGATAQRRSVSMKRGWRLWAAMAVTTACCLGQTDPGPRSGAAGAGGPFSGLNTNQQAYFNSAKAIFAEVDSVTGTIAGEEGKGLGPTFNGNSCAQCHAQPTVGGTSPAPFSPQVPQPNPQLALATLHGATNVVPSFITA